MSRPPSARQGASRRLAQLGAVCRVLRREGIQPALAVWGPAVAQTLASAPRCYALIASAPKAVWPGLTQDSLRDALIRMGFKPAEQELSEFTERTAKHGKPVEAQLLGSLIGLTAEQRRKARAWSIVAVDQPRRLLKEESAQRRKEQSAKAQTAARRKSGAVSRKEYLESVRALVPAGKTRNAINVAACRARMKAGSSALLSTVMKAGPSADLSMIMKARASAEPNMNVSGSVSKPINIGANGRSMGQVDVASDARLQRSEPSNCPGLGAGSSAEDRCSITFSPEAVSPGSRKRLSDVWRSPKSEASKKGTSRLGRPYQVEDPREVLMELFPCRIDRGWLLEEAGEGDHERGLNLLATLGIARLHRLRVEVDRAGGMIKADDAIAAARSAALEIETQDQAARSAGPR